MAQDNDAKTGDHPTMGAGSRERPWILTSPEKAEALPEGAWYVVMAAEGRAPGAPVRQKRSSSV
jgi:hypothetical protein